MINAELNNRIINLWNKRFKGENVPSPLFFWQFEKHPILYVGLNPSFVEKFRKKYGKLLVWNGTRKDNDSYVNKVIDIDAPTKKYYRKSFGRMIDFSKEINIPFEHIDLFFYRETNQNKFKKGIFDSKNKELNDFGKDQLKIAVDAIRIVYPRVIIINNAFASDIFKKYCGGDLSFDDDRGWHVIKINSREVPIFFSSMLGGKRSLDNHTWERLKWHIKKSLDLTAIRH